MLQQLLPASLKAARTFFGLLSQLRYLKRRDRTRELRGWRRASSDLPVQSLECRTYLAGSPFSADLDGVGELEQVTIDSGTMTVTSGSASPVRYEIGDISGVEIVDLDGQPGNEVLFYATVADATVFQSNIAHVVTHRSRSVQAYDVGPTNNMRIVELNGQPGKELFFHRLLTINGIEQPILPAVLTHRNSTVAKYDEVDGNNIQIVELDGQAGDEIFISFDGIRTSATLPPHVITQRTGVVQTYQTGWANNARFAELDGQPGAEILFYDQRSINGLLQPFDPVVVTHRTGALDRYDAGTGNNIAIADLDNQPGDEVLFYADGLEVSIARPPHVLTQRTKSIRSYEVGRANNVRLAELDGEPGLDVLFYRNWSINGFEQPLEPVIVTHRIGAAFPYDSGDGNQVEIADLDGVSGDEVLIYYSGFGITGTQPNNPHVITHRTRTVNTYDVGANNNMRIADLDGQPGNEVLFFVNGSVLTEIQPNAPRVITHRTRAVNAYDVGATNNVRIADLDGQPGNEVLFFLFRNAFGEQSPVVPAVLTHRSGIVTRYNIQAASEAYIVQLDGLPGMEVLFTQTGAEHIVLTQRDRSLRQATVYIVSNGLDSGNGSLRQAILDANSSNAPTIWIAFYAPLGADLIKPLSPLPSITRKVTIVGSNSNGDAPGVELSGEFAGSNANGLTILGNDIVVRGLNISRFSGNGILIQGGANNWLAGNYIGTDKAGNFGVGNGQTGVTINSGATSNRLGTDGDGQFDHFERNLISGNGQWGVRIDGATTANNFIAGNYVGTNAAGTAAIGNGWWGIAVSGPNNLIGGSRLTGLGNLVSGNNQGGIVVLNRTAVGNRIQGNYVGLTAAGTGTLGNAFSGILVADWGVPGEGPTNTLVGGGAAGVGNVISANGQFGVWISGSTTAGTIVAGNFIGTNSTGSSALANASNGVLINAGAHDTRIGTDSNGINDSSERNVISGNGQAGISVVDHETARTLIAGNHIGLNASGNAKLANNGDGIYLSASVDTNIDANIVSGNNSNGIYVRGGLYTGGAGGTGTVITSNKIGTNADGTAVLGNRVRGVQIDAGSSGTRIGSDGNGINDHLEGNLISGNGGEGIAVGTRETDDTIIRRNYIGTDITGEIDFGNGFDGVLLREWFYSPNSEGSPKRAVVEDNVISGNGGLGISIAGLGSDSHRISGNKIGTNSSGTRSIANAGGIGVFAGAKGSVIGTNGDGANDAHEGNIVSGNTDYGINIEGAGTDNTVIAGNFIGLTVDGLSALPNRGNGGVIVTRSAKNTRIGTDGNTINDVDERNVIAGNDQEGIQVEGEATNGTIIAGNYVGVAANGIDYIPNKYSGILVWGGAPNTRIGTNGDGVNDSDERNFISGNGTDGIQLASPGANSFVAGNTIESNVRAGVSVSPKNQPSVFVRRNNFSNNGFGIDFGVDGPTLNDPGDVDGVRNAPVITKSEIREGMLVIEGFAKPGTFIELYTSDEYANRFGQGEELLATLLEGGALDQSIGAGTYGPTLNGVVIGSDTTNRFSFSLPLSGLPSGVVAGMSLTAASIGPNSEFSATSEIVDVNDPPVVLPSQFLIIENLANGSPVGTVVATDPDQGQTKTFAIIGGNTNGAFAINPATGQITVANSAALDFETTPSFSLTVQATDNQLPALSGSATILINLSDANDAPKLNDLIVNQLVDDFALINPFATLTVTDPDHQNMLAKVTILNGTVRGDFTAASTAGWTRAVSGNNIIYSRFYYPQANVGSVVQAALRNFVFVPRNNSIKPNTSELTDIQVFLNDGIANTTSTTRLTTTSVNDAPTIGGVSNAVAVNDDATVNPLATLTVTDSDLQEMLISVTILNGVNRGDFTNATSANGWTVRQVLGNNITYKRYFNPQANVGAVAQAAFRALIFQPRENAIKPGMTELTDFQVTVSDGVAPAGANTGTRVTTTSVNNAPGIANALANQTMNDNHTKAVFSTLTVTDPDTQDQFVRITITNGVNRGDFSSASIAGWTRKLSGANIVYERFFAAAANNGTVVQSAIRALVFQPRNNVPIGTTETTSFTVFVNDGLANATNSATSVITTGVAPRPAIETSMIFDGEVATIVVPSAKRSASNPLARLLRKSRQV